MISEHSAGTEGLPPIGAAAHWQQTLWAMVGIQFVMTAAFSMLTPIMPLFLPVLGVESEAAIDIWAGVLNGVTSLIAAFASPLWGQVADRHGRKLMLLRSSLAIGLFTALMGAATDVWQFFGCRALMGVFAQVAGGEDNDWDMLVPRVQLEPTQHFIAVDIGHANVKQHQIGWITLDQL